MRHFLLSILAAGTIISAAAQSKINPQGLSLIQEYNEIQAAKAEGRGASRTTTADLPARMNVIVRLEPGADIDALTADPDFTLVASRGNFAIVNMPLARVEQFADAPAVRSLSLGVKAKSHLNDARKYASDDPVQAGTGLPQPYTGKGVYAALFDTGLEPNHINFLGEDGKTRVKGIWTVFGSTDPEVKEYITEQEITKFTTETSNDTHGTHVLGIISGSYKGEGYFGGSYSPANRPCEYWGVAPDADILIGCGELWQADILAGVDRIVGKAEEDGKPVVVNLSLGSNYGPHDGSDDFSQMLAEYGKSAIISISAGNEGDENIGISYDFTDKNKTFRTGLYATNPEQQFKGSCEFWMNDGTVPEAKIIIYSRLYGREEYKMDIPDLRGKSLILTGEKSKQAGATKTAIFDDAWDENSYVKVYSGIDPNNNRFYIYIDEDLNYISKTKQKDYAIGIQIKAQPGKSLTGYADPGDQPSYYAEFTNFDISSWQSGTPNGSINDMACGENVICIGAFVTRKNWTNLDGSSRWYGGEYIKGNIAPFSSYGTLWDGRNLPDLCAPGSTLISSVSSYYVNKVGNIDRNVCGQVEDGNKTYYWQQMQGTSMASPFAAGTFVAWLEADPTLTIDRVKQIAKATAVKGDGYDKTDPIRWGAGEINVLEGIKMVIAGSGIGTVEADPDAASDDRALVVTSPSRGIFEILFAGATSLDATLYTLAGVPVATVRTDAPEATLDATASPRGIYLLRVATPSATVTRKVTL
ncbi:MAG: S8 family peptidase [Muribaculaceae bacterium]|nr:S8 family peptidase [Muribaculaceae bacterium]